MALDAFNTATFAYATALEQRLYRVSVPHTHMFTITLPSVAAKTGFLECSYHVDVRERRKKDESVDLLVALESNSGDYSAVLLEGLSAETARVVKTRPQLVLKLSHDDYFLGKTQDKRTAAERAFIGQTRKARIKDETVFHKYKQVLQGVMIDGKMPVTRHYTDPIQAIDDYDAEEITLDLQGERRLPADFFYKRRGRIRTDDLREAKERGEQFWRINPATRRLTELSDIMTKEEEIALGQAKDYAGDLRERVWPLLLLHSLRIWGAAPKAISRIYEEFETNSYLKRLVHGEDVGLGSFSEKIRPMVNDYFKLERDEDGDVDDTEENQPEEEREGERKSANAQTAKRKGDEVKRIYHSLRKLVKYAEKAQGMKLYDQTWEDLAQCISDLPWRGSFQTGDIKQVLAVECRDRIRQEVEQRQGKNLARDVGQMWELVQLYRRSNDYYQGTILKFERLNERLVRKIAGGITAHGVAYEDKVQMGIEGLQKAGRYYDWTKQCKFSTYATWWIKQSIRRDLINTGRTIRIPVHATEALQRLNKAEAAIMGRGETITPELLAKALNLNLEKVDWLLRTKRMATVRSLDAPVGDEGSDALGDFIPSDDRLGGFAHVAKAPDAEAERRELQERIKRMASEAMEIAGLHARERDVLLRRFGFYTGEKETLEEIGAAYGLTRERIRQIEVKALKKFGRVSLDPELAEFFSGRGRSDDVMEGE